MWRDLCSLFLAVAISTMGAALIAGGCSSDDSVKAQPASSQAYRGHENDADSNYLVQAYLGIVGTRIDDCQTCHTAGVVQGEYRGEIKDMALNPCSFCHLIAYPDESVISGAPATYEETLNSYGLAYKNAGRNTEALTSIGAIDSDGDGFSNQAEIEALRYPGDAGSTPAQETVPIFTILWDDLAALGQHEQFMLMNAHRQQFDEYVNYGGVRVADVLAAAGVELSAEMTITCLAPDGYAKDFSYEQITQSFPRGLYYPNLDPGSFEDPDQGFVVYPPADQIPTGVEAAGDTIPDIPWLIVAKARNGQVLETSYLDVVSGKIAGEGPYRLIAPQGSYGVPGAPDRGTKYSPSGYDDGHDFEEAKDHNAGLCIKGLVAIRVNPMPAGYEEFDWKNGGYALVDARKLIIYGAGVSGN